MARAILRGAACGEARRVRGAGRSRDADRRLCLRPPHDRGIAEARLAGRCDRARRRLSASERRDARRRRATSLPACRRTARSSSMGWRSACCPRRRTNCASEIRCSRWCIIRWRWKPVLSPADAEALADRASATRLRPRAASSSPAHRPRQLLVDDYDVPPELITVARPGTDRGETAKGSSDGIVRLLSVGSVVPRKGYRRADRGARAAREPAVAADDRRRPHARRGGRGAARRRYRKPRARRPDRRAGRAAGGPHRRALCRRRPVRAGLALRGLRHGVRRGAGARPAGDRHHGGRHSRHGAARTPACWSSRTT